MTRIPRISPSTALSALALFVALGGTTYAATQIHTSDIANNAVISTKIKDGQIKNSDLASNAVTSSKVANGTLTGADLALNTVTGGNILDGSLTAADVAPSTFLGATAQAADSAKLGGIDSTGYIHGTGQLVANRLLVPLNAPRAVVLSVPGVGDLDATCFGSNPNTLFFNQSGQTVDSTLFDNSAHIMALPNTIGQNSGNILPQAFQTWQESYVGPSGPVVATISVSLARTGVNCLYTAQAFVNS